MNDLSKGTRITLAVLALAVTLLIPSVGYVFGSITDLQVEQAVTQTKQASIQQDVGEIKTDVRLLRNLFFGPPEKKPSTE